MKVRNSQLRDFLNTIKYDEELLKQMKEKFYLEKIQEAKDEKGVAQFRWNELPIEVEEKIMEWKKVVEMGGVVKARYTAAAEPEASVKWPRARSKGHAQNMRNEAPEKAK